MKKIIILIFVFISITSVVEAQEYVYRKALGLFMSLGVGPRIPLGSASEELNLAAGADVTFSYADNEFLPFFVYTRIGFQHFPGRQKLYESTDYSSLSNNAINIDLGARYFFPPIMEQMVLVMPVLEMGPSLALFEKLHQFKDGSGRENYLEKSSYLGFHVAAGFSMFILDVTASYYYFYHNQFLSIDFKVRLPIFVRL